MYHIGKRGLEQFPLFKILRIHFVPWQGRNINFLGHASMEFPTQIWCSEIIGRMTEDKCICPSR
jgi:hypothetical protein